MKTYKTDRNQMSELETCIRELQLCILDACESTLLDCVLCIDPDGLLFLATPYYANSNCSVYEFMHAENDTDSSEIENLFLEYSEFNCE